MKIEEISKTVRTDIENIEEVEWFSIFESPFEVRGVAFNNENLKISNVISRLPYSQFGEIEKVNANLTVLALHTAGGQIHFSTNASDIYVYAKLKHKHNMCNMTAVAQNGFDCYLQYQNERPKFYASTNFDIMQDEYVSHIVKLKDDKKFKNVILNMPLFECVEKVFVGLNSGCEKQKSNFFGSDKKIVFYGTSINQGGCVSRSGMSYPNIISRLLRTESINFGFSGNGLGEKIVAEQINEIENVELIVIDIEANSATNGCLKKNLNTFVETLLNHNENVCILIVSRIKYLGDFIDNETKALRDEMREHQKKIVGSFKAKGYKNIFFANGYEFFGEDFDEFTVDGIHPTDLGNYIMAFALEKQIKDILGDDKSL